MIFLEAYYFAYSGARSPLHIYLKAIDITLLIAYTRKDFAFPSTLRYNLLSVKEIPSPPRSY